MKTAYIVDCVRTPGGKRKGTLGDIHPVDLGAAAINGLIARNKMDYKLVDDVIWGCVSQIGPQSNNIGRNVVLASNLPVTVPGTTVDRQCGSALQAMHLATQAVMSGVQDIVICGGVESMTKVALGSNAVIGMKAGMDAPITSSIHAKYPDAGEPPIFSQFLGSELVAKEFKVTRQEADQFSVESHAYAARATKEGRFKNEIVPVQGSDKDGNDVTLTVDEGIRPQTTLESLSKLKTLSDDGIHTAGSASQVTDGASCILIMNEEGLRRTGLKPRAKIICSTVAGDDPVIMLRAPIFSTQKAFDKLNIKASDIDIYEINEAFAAIPLMMMKKFNIPRDKVNPNGGAIALGHPLGSTGTKITTTLVNELERTGKKRGLITLCEGGGMANTIIIERIDTNAKL